jgi:DNA-binding response OmpR family regulator
MNATLKKPAPACSADITTTDFSLLLVGAVEDDDIGGRSIFSQFRWQTRRANSYRQALPLIRQELHPVVVSERDLPDGNWKDVLRLASAQKEPPVIIVTSRLADDYLWAEVLNLGGYDVLAQPFDRNEVHRTINLAWQHWKNQREVLHHGRKAESENDDVYELGGRNQASR